MPVKSFTATLDQLGNVLGFVRDQLKAFHKDEAFRTKIELVTEEMFVNIARYAYQKEGGEVQVSVDVADDGCCTLVFKDQGHPFNPITKEDPHNVDLPIEEHPIGGWGIGLCRQIMDALDYHHDGESNVLTLTKGGRSNAPQ